MEPVHIQPFKNIHVVTCGFCNGEGLADNGFGLETCCMCKGAGTLIDVRTGTLRLYTTDYLNENEKDRKP